MNPREALAALIANPAAFLKHYPVKIAGAGGNLNTTNVRTYFFDKQGAWSGIFPGETLGHKGATRPGLFKDHQISSFRFNHSRVSADTALTRALVVPMVNYNSTLYGCHDMQGDVTAMPHFRLDGSGDGLMLTGELSGCCFSWIDYGANLICTHVQPHAGIDGIKLQTKLTTQGRFAAVPTAPLNTFGRTDYPSRASIIGVCKGAQWYLYAQTSSDSLKTITGAYQIHPGPKRRL